MVLAHFSGTHPSERTEQPNDDCWVLDVDGCLVDSLSGTSLRPGSWDPLGHLARTGRRILLWSDGGDVYDRKRAKQFAIDDHVYGYFAKSRRDPKGFYYVDRLPPCRRRVFVGDRPEDLCQLLEVIAGSPYWSDDRHDRGLDPLVQRASLYASSSVNRESEGAPETQLSRYIPPLNRNRAPVGNSSVSHNVQQ